MLGFARVGSIAVALLGTPLFFLVNPNSLATLAVALGGMAASLAGWPNTVKASRLGKRAPIFRGSMHPMTVGISLSNWRLHWMDCEWQIPIWRAENERSLAK